MQKTDVLLTEFDLIHAYNSVIRGLDREATDNQNRAYGGMLRAGRARLLESMTRHMTKLAWKKLGCNPDRLSFNDIKKYKLPVHPDYLEKLPDFVKSSIKDYSFNVQVDLHIFADRELVMAIECKSYTENAMLKRVLVDFNLLKVLHPDLVCCLLQMESQLGGDYSKPLKKNKIGNPSTHTIMSYFPNVKLYIITLLEGERKVDHPIYKNQYFKELKKECLDLAIDHLKDLLKPFA